MHPRLVALGWDPAWELARSTVALDDLEPARVATQHRGGYVLCTAGGDASAVVSGRLRHGSRTAAAFPVVGDWVLVREGVIHAVLPRRTAFSRKVAWAATEEQVAAANVDVVFVVAALDTAPNLRRLERYLTVAYESGAEPVVLLNKSDLCPDVGAAQAAVREIAPGTPVHALSALAGDGLAVLDAYCRPGRTAVFLGPSGVGKTTLLNTLTGADRPTAAVLEDGRGRHTTTHRELVLVNGRGLVIDTPGMRELQLWDADAGLSAVFADIDALAGACRFGDCTHEAEPGCAIRAAIGAGRLDPERYASYRKLEREEAHVTKKRDALALSEEKRLRKIFARSIRRAGWRGQD
ncbi:MAG TPA: ribosome small subunit-dependent GTPase A [Chloroflexi bacterium]|jgi:ribosome biogenesis GTPase|nr:ribosome small subunit-dependent GTPase A [Chloroflexota bacterium]